MRLTLLSISLLTATKILAQEYVINMSTATINPSTFVLTDAEINYDPQANGYYNAPAILSSGGPAAYPAWLEVSAPKSGGGPNPDGTDTDRFEYIVCSELNVNAPAFNGVPHTQTFWLQILESSSEPSHQGVVVQQWWQGAGTDGQDYSPPVYVYLTKPKSKGDPWGLTFNIKNNKTGTEIWNNPIVVYAGGLYPGNWINVSVTATPGYNNNGSASIAINGSTVGQYQGNVGYDPYTTPGASWTFRVKNGLYRPNGSPAMQFGFSNITYQ